MGWAALVLCLAQQDDARAAREMWERGERAAAIELLEGELGRRGQDAELRAALVQALISVHRYAAALEHAKALGADGAAARGLALCRLGRHAEALEELPRDEVESLLLRVDAAEALARFEESDAALEQLAKRIGGSDPRVVRLEARKLARQGRHEQSREKFEQALKHDPFDPASLFGLGQTLLKLGEREAGLKVLAEHRRITPLLDQLDFARRAVDLSPNHAPNVAALGDAERALGRFERAESAYAKASGLAEPEQLVPIALRRARLHAEQLSDAKRAIELLDEAAKRVADARLLVRAGDMAMELGDRNGAAKRFERALELRPNDREILERLELARTR